MSAVTAGKLLAAAGAGVVAGVTGMILYNTSRAGDSKQEPRLEQEPRALPATELLATPARQGDSSVASEFLMPFVKRYGLPDLDQVILPSQEFITCWDSRTRNARWVVERLNLDTISGPGDRSKAYFRADPRLEPLFRNELSDFRGSGYDRGHLAPAGDHKTTQKGMKETFLLTNMSPQEPSFNRGYWSDFEEFIRTLVEPSKDGGGQGPPATRLGGPLFKDVYVITGPLYLASREELPRSTRRNATYGTTIDVDGIEDGEEGVANILSSSSSSSSFSVSNPASKWVVKHDILGNPLRMVAVPTHFFKVIVAEPYPPSDEGSASDDSPPKTYVAAFAMPNADIPNNFDLRNFLVPLEALESVAGMRFLGAASSRIDGLDRSTREFLDNEAVEVREEAGVAPLTSDWVNRRDNGYRLLKEGSAAEEREKRLYRHLCKVTSCKGV